MHDQIQFTIKTKWGERMKAAIVDCWTPWSTLIALMARNTHITYIYHSHFQASFSFLFLFHIVCSALFFFCYIPSVSCASFADCWYSIISCVFSIKCFQAIYFSRPPARSTSAFCSLWNWFNVDRFSITCVLLINWINITIICRQTAFLAPLFVHMRFKFSFLT